LNNNISRAAATSSTDLNDYLLDGIGSGTIIISEGVAVAIAIGVSDSEGGGIIVGLRVIIIDYVDV
jgi:pantothenate kinase